MSVNVDRNSLLAAGAGNTGARVTVGKPKPDSVTIDFQHIDDPRSACLGAMSAATICQGANGRLLDVFYYLDGDDRRDNYIELVFQETKEETVNTTYGELKVGDFYFNESGVRKRKIQVDTKVCSVAVEPGWAAFASCPPDSQQVKKIVRKMAPDRVAGTFAEAVLDVLANYVVPDPVRGQ